MGQFEYAKWAEGQLHKDVTKSLVRPIKLAFSQHAKHVDDKPGMQAVPFPGAAMKMAFSHPRRLHVNPLPERGHERGQPVDSGPNEW